MQGGDRPPRPPTPERLPTGRLVRSRVVTDLGSVLADALDRRLDGYAVVEPQEALLLGADGAGVLGFRGGVPVGAHHAGSGRDGPAALADLAAAGPYSVELRAVEDAAALGAFDRERCRVGAATPAERLAGDQALAARTRRVVDDRRRVGGDTPTHDSTADAQSKRDRESTTTTGSSTDAGHESAPRVERPAESDGRRPPAGESVGSGPEDPVVAFLEDERRIAAIREEAREQARERAAEWGLTDHLED